MRTVLLLLASNLFMTAAWYGHLRHRDLPLWLAIAHPLVFFALLAACMIAAVLLARLLWRGIRRLTTSST